MRRYSLEETEQGRGNLSDLGAITFLPYLPKVVQRPRSQDFSLSFWAGAARGPRERSKEGGWWYWCLKVSYEKGNLLAEISGCIVMERSGNTEIPLPILLFLSSWAQ